MGRHTPGQKARGRNNWWAIAAGLLVVLLFGVLVTRCANQSQSSSSQTSPTGDGASSSSTASVSKDCGPVSVGTTTELAEVVRAQAKAISDDCHSYSVEVIESQTFTTAAASGRELPDVWIPDSDLWATSAKQSLPSNGIELALTPRAVIATSPAVIAVPKSLAKPTNTGVQPYLSALAQLPLAAAPPNDFTPTVLSYAAVWDELRDNPMAQSMMGNAFFQVTRAAVPPDALFDFATKDAKQARAFPASEQQIWVFNKKNPGNALSAVTPASGAPLLQYDYVDVGKQATGVAKGSELLLKRLQSAKAQEALREAGFRAGKVEQPFLSTVPLKLPGKTPDITVESFDKLRIDWNRLSVDTQLLVAVDVSGSMKAKAGNTTRAQLAAQTVTAAVGQMPPTSEAGLWAFSTNQQAGGVPYRELVQVAPLGDPNDPHSQARKLIGTAGRLPSMLQGDTGLYDTIWAAYQAQQRNAQPSLESIVVVITDGKNDNPGGGLTVDQLIQNIQGAKDPARPVRVVLLGMGPETDVAAMKKVTDSIGGTTAVATDPTQLTGVFAQAVWSLAPNRWSE